MSEGTEQTSSEHAKGMRPDRGLGKTIRTVAATMGCVALLLPVAASARGARPTRHHRAIRVPAHVSEDAAMLSILAPPSLRATQEQTYGDATYARLRLQRRIADGPGADRLTAPFGIYPCDRREAGSAGYTCVGDPARPGYGQYYAYLPANASAPQVPRGDPGEQSRILAPATALSWAVNALRFDPHN